MQEELFFFSGDIWIYWNDTADDILIRFTYRRYYECQTVEHQTD